MDIKVWYQNLLVRLYTKSFRYNPLDIKLALDAATAESLRASGRLRDLHQAHDVLREKYNKFGEDVRQVINRIVKRPAKPSDFKVLKPYGIEVVMDGAQRTKRADGPKGAA